MIELPARNQSLQGSNRRQTQTGRPTNRAPGGVAYVGTDYFDLPGLCVFDAAPKVLSFSRQLCSLPFWLACSAFSLPRGTQLDGAGVAVAVGTMVGVGVGS